MKTRIYLLIAIMAMTATLSSCTTEGGDIGDLYGEWILKSMTIDGVNVSPDTDVVSFRFQGDMVGITVTTEHNNFQVSWGRWSRSGDILKLDYTYHNADADSENSPLFNPPAWLGIPGRTVTDLRVDKIDDSDMTLSMTAPDGKKYTYILKKLH